MGGRPPGGLATVRTGGGCQPGYPSFDPTRAGMAMVLTEKQQLVTPVTWLVAPELLTINQALYLSGWSESLLRWAVCEGWVIAYDGDDGDWLIDGDSLDEARETLVLVANGTTRLQPLTRDERAFVLR